MLRIRTVGTLVLAVALLAAACGEEPDIDPQVEVGAPSSTQAGPDEPPAPADPPEADVAEPSDSGDATPSDSDDPEDIGSSEDSDRSAPVAAETLLASATTQLSGRSARGEATVELAPGFSMSTNFESDADGDLVATVEIPPGMDPEFPGGADAEVRYVGGVTYVRPPVSAETLADLGVDEAWYVLEPSGVGDPMNDVMGSAGGVLCVFPQMLDGPLANCDLLGETGAFLEAASEAEIVGREDVRGAEATRVRLVVSLLDLAGEALGMEPGDSGGETSEGGVFDDTASDPFAEGLDQIFGFLDAAFEVDVWIDDESLIRRLEFDLASLFAGFAGADAAGEMPSSLITLEFYAYDAEIAVEAPPPEAVVDRSLLLGDDDFASSEEYDDDDEYDDDYDDE